jgi:hypothetical protein
LRSWQVIDWLIVTVQPVILEESRYEYYQTPPGDVPAWFRQLFWVCILSGGHATYGGIK